MVPTGLLRGYREIGYPRLSHKQTQGISSVDNKKVLYKDYVDKVVYPDDAPASIHR